MVRIPIEEIYVWATVYFDYKLTGLHSHTALENKNHHFVRRVAYKHKYLTHIAHTCPWSNRLFPVKPQQKQNIYYKERNNYRNNQAFWRGCKYNMIIKSYTPQVLLIKFDNVYTHAQTTHSFTQNTHVYASVSFSIPKKKDTSLFFTIHPTMASCQISFPQTQYLVQLYNNISCFHSLQTWSWTVQIILTLYI